MDINKATLEWLLEDENPSVRYFALNAFQDHITPADISSTREAIRTYEPVIEIMKKLEPEGYWEKKNSFYHQKYTGTVWQLMILAELGYPKDRSISDVCEFILTMSQAADGGFSTHYGKREGMGLQSKAIPCLTGNMTWAMIHFGYLEDPRIQRAIQWILDNQRADDGDKPDTPDWFYKKHTACFSGHTCFMGLVKSLKALSAIPMESRSDAVLDKIDELSEFMLKHHLFKESHNLKKVAKPGWKRFGFPLMYQTDVLEILTIFSDLNIEDPRMEEALGLVRNKQVAPQRWLMDNSFNGKMIADIEKKGEASKWITLRALKVLKHYNAL